MSPTPEAQAALEERYERLPIECVMASTTNPRTHFDDVYLAELANSILEKGLIQPILVRQVDAGSHKPMQFEIVAGECRYRASKIAQRSHIPAVIRQYTDEQVLELQLIENIHRKDLTALEQAAGYRALIKSNPDKHSAATIASRIGMSEAWVWDRLKLNDLIPEAKKILERDQMTVGHAILIARLKPADQARVIEFDDDASTQYRGQGLWRHDSGFEFDEDDPANRGKRRPTAYESLKPCSVRELEAWIRDHIRFDVAHAAKAQPLTFDALPTRVSEAEAKPGRGKKVISITHEYRVADDARDESERTYGSESWERADGQEKSKTCEYSVLGVVVAGRGQGDTLQVCVNRDKCKVHFGAVIRQREKNATLRASGKGQQAARADKKSAEKQQDKWKREQAERSQRESAWKAIEKAVVVDAVAQVKDVKGLTAAHAKALEAARGELGFREIKEHLGAQWFKSPAAALLVSAVTESHFNSWGNKETGFDQFVRTVAKPFGLDINRLQAVRDKHQPKAAAAPAKKAS